MAIAIDSDLAQLRNIHEGMQAHLNRGNREDCIKAGKKLAAIVTDPNWVGIQNGLAAILEQYRAAFMATFAEVPAPVPAPAPAPTGRPMPQGTYTVEYMDGDYRTIEFETITEGTFAGKTIVSYLSGPDNERDFQGFAFVGTNGAVHVWKRYAGINVRWVNAVQTVLSRNADDRLGLAEAYAHRSGRCARCGRKLTVPTSLHRGYGPDCAAQLGIG